MNSPTSSPADFQAHIYNSFLQGKTADVALRVRGTWEAVYNLHRVVLIQAGFFRSLFTGGFVESADKPTAIRGQDQIEVVFDDTNITRAARLYGGGPPLFIDSAYIPTAAQPLTPSFPIPAVRAPTPPDHQPTPPRFLLSLLAVAVYLSVPSLATQALSSIMRSVGPFTVIQYLNFAIGKGIGPALAEDQDPAVGLESVAKTVKSEHNEAFVPASRARKEKGKEVDALAQSLESLAFDPGHDIVQKEDPAEMSSDSDDAEHSGDDQPSELYLHYGAVSDKIGEAAACWLARWGADMLVYEQQTVQQRTAFSASISGRAPGRRSTVSSGLNPSVGIIPAPPVVPVIWRRGGLEPAWVRALVSSDSLFVKGERERYELAKAVVELRRNEGIVEEEEVEWAKMFAEGIYYANMSLDDLVFVSQDRSPTTHRPYVPKHVIQAAHWSQAMLRHQIQGRSPSSPPSSPTRSSQDKELGLPITTSELAAKLSEQAEDVEPDQLYWPVPSDSSVRIGDSTGIEGVSMDELFERASGAGTHRISLSEATFFGLKPERHRAHEVPSAKVPGTTHWIAHPPYRFAVEFWDVDALREKSRLHSHTIWYAGSLFNVYVQLVRKKSQGVQLGVYLHRQSSVDAIPPASAPFGLYPVDRAVDKTARHGRALSTPTAVPPTSPIQYSYSGLPLLNINSRSNTPVPGSPSPTGVSPTGALPATAPPVTPAQPYRDPRSAVKAYFTLSCASATGSSLTRFSSAPDVFSVSQSWGWKSSSLRTEEYLEVGKDGELPTAVTGEKEVSLRVTVVLGIV
ncbi:hypothetical protein BV25DRAFT_1907234 [Artomyces pyxidatus]|uniref:Uncharacterized protein n=1 Tax=Artomyces pyxidatus TaxID=48021 RepID=A0ACB8T4R6_9AGAM|nr:hypothetical protein BV25DRAFT_1907234 [Artomyces pyxidatus]